MRKLLLVGLSAVFAASSGCTGSRAEDPVPETIDAGTSPDGGGQVANRAPVLDSPAKLILVEMQSKTLTYTASDADGDALTISFEGLPPFAERSENRVTFSPRQGDVGTYSYRVTVSDGQALDSLSGSVEVLSLEDSQLSGSIAFEGGAAVTNDPLVTLELNVNPSARGTKLTEMSFSIDGGAYSAAEPFASRKEGLSLGAGNGERTVSARVTDDAGNQRVFSATIVLDTAPPVGSVGFFATHVNEVIVEVELDATDETTEVAEYAVSNDGVTFTPVNLTGNSVAWELDGGDGEKTVYARFTDKAGNSSVAEGKIVLDTAKPTIGLSFVRLVKDPNVVLDVLATDDSGILELCFSNDPDLFIDCHAPVSQKNWTLEPGDGEKRVYMRAADLAGNEAIAFANFLLDTTAPVAAFTLGGGGGYTNAQTIDLVPNATDAGSGVEWWEVSIDGGATWSARIPHAQSYELTLPAADGLVTVHVRAIDKVGNVSTAVTQQVLVDRTAPSVSLSVLGAPASWLVEHDVELSVTASDPGGAVSSGFGTMEFANETDAYGPPEPFAPTRIWTLAPGDGARTVRLRVTDRAGNQAETTVTRDVDTTRPTGTVLINGGAVATNARAVTLTISSNDQGSGVNAMCIRTVAAEPSESDACWVPPATSASLNLPTVEGSHTVHVWFRDAAGWTSIPAATSSILYDVTPPPPPVFPAFRSRGNRSVRLDWSAPSDASGIEGYEICASRTSGSGYFNCQDWVRNSGKPEHTMTGLANGVPAYIVVRAIDRAGNVSANSEQITGEPRYSFQPVQRMPMGGTFHAAHNFNADEQIAVGEGGAVYRTTDRWTTATRIDPLVDTTLYGLQAEGSLVRALGDKGTITVSFDRGASWTTAESGTSMRLNGAAALGSTGVQPFQIHHHVAVGERGTIRRRLSAQTLCLGPCPEKWEHSGELNPPTTQEFRAVAAVAGGPTAVAVGDGGIIYQSVDRGATWTQRASGVTSILWSVANVPSSNIFYAAGDGGVLLRSSDGGSTWTRLTTSPALSVGDSIRTIAAASTTRIYLAVSSPNTKIHEYSGSTNALRTISIANDGCTLRGLGLRPGNATEPALTAVGFNGCISSTLNAAVTSPTFKAGHSGLLGEFRAMAFAPGGRFWVSGSNGQGLYSSDMGNTWVNAPAPAGQAHTRRAIAVLGTDSAFAVGDGGSIWRWNTSAWQSVTAPAGTPRLTDVSCVSTTRCFAVGDEATVLEWKNNAWSILRRSPGWTPNVGISTYVANGVERAILVGERGEVETLEGSTWTNRNPIPGQLLSAVHARSTGTVIAVGANGKIYRSTDHGVSWTSVASGVTLGLNEVTTGAGNRWYIAGNLGVLLESTNDGATWTALQSNSAQNLSGLVAFQSINHRIWAAGTGSTLLYSGTTEGH